MKRFIIVPPVCPSCTMFSFVWMFGLLFVRDYYLVAAVDQSIDHAQFSINALVEMSAVWWRLLSCLYCPEKFLVPGVILSLFLYCGDVDCIGRVLKVYDFSFINCVTNVKPLCFLFLGCQVVLMVCLDPCVSFHHRMAFPSP